MKRPIMAFFALAFALPALAAIELAYLFRTSIYPAPVRQQTADCGQQPHIQPGKARRCERAMSRRTPASS